MANFFLGRSELRKGGREFRPSVVTSFLGFLRNAAHPPLFANAREIVSIGKSVEVETSKRFPPRLNLN